MVVHLKRVSGRRRRKERERERERDVTAAIIDYSETI